MNVTPVILTLNEASNIQLTLASLEWAPRVVVVDSGSTDQTEQIARSFPNVAWFFRDFDNHREQWLYGIHKTCIDSDYVLALDADMRPGLGFEDELRMFVEGGHLAGGVIPFDYRTLGRNLMGSIYPPQLRLFQKGEVHINQPGHTQIFEVGGPVAKFRSHLIHEDLKPISRWLTNQLKYASLEAGRIKCSGSRNLKDRLRLAGVSPPIWGIYAYLKAGGPFRSAASRAYAYERVIFEAILARMLADSAECHNGVDEG
jgi:hypothetical protein